MTAADIGFWIATAAAVISAFYTAIMYHRPKAAAMTKPAGKSGRGQPISRKLVIPWALAFAAWAAVAFDYADRHWLSAEPESPISAENADIDVQRWERGPVTTDTRQYSVNLHLINRGKALATNVKHVGFAATGGALEKPYLDGFILSMKAQLRTTPQPPGMDIRPGQDNLWFTVLGPPEEDKFNRGLADGTLPMFVFSLIKYQDKTVPKDRYIYTESCVSLQKDTVKFCEGGHNRTYISD
jgi:hypothetical protein